MTDIFEQPAAPLKEPLVEHPEWVKRCRILPFDHQIIGVETMRERLYFLLADEMGAGKSKQVIDLAQVLYSTGMVIRKVIVITEASIRSVWFDQEFGELAKHLWKGLPSRVTEYHQKLKTWTWESERSGYLDWIVTNYDYVINAERLAELCDYADKTTLLILDESSAVKNHKAERTKACLKLRKKCGRVVLLNGTPIANSPLDMFSQGNVMDPSILNLVGITHFRAKYAVMGGYVAEVRRGGRIFRVPTQIISWQNLDDLSRRFAPYVLRRLKKDCMDLPEKMPPVILTKALTPETWRIYKQMRDEMVAYLGSGVSMTQQTIAKIMRLAQITSGFLGGIEELDTLDFSDNPNENLPDFLTLFEGGDAPALIDQVPKRHLTVQEIGREKLDLFLEWFDARLLEDASFKLLVWCRFLPELHRLVKELREKYSNVRIESMYGGQPKDERERALRLLDPRTTNDGPGVVAATIGTGGKGHTFTAAHTILNLSFDYSLEKYLQAMDRVHRFGQTHAVSYYDVAATGPAGQKTIDHVIIRARLQKEDLATLTTSMWVKRLREED